MSDNNNLCSQHTVSVTVLSSRDGFVVVEQALECANCKSSCLLAQKKKSFTIKTNKSYEKGSHINIIIDEKYMINLALLLYGMPILIMIISAFIADMLFQKEIITALTALFSLILSWGILKYVSKNLKRSPIHILD